MNSYFLALWLARPLHPISPIIRPFPECPSLETCHFFCPLILLSRHFRRLPVGIASIDKGKDSPYLLTQILEEIDHSTSVPGDNVLLTVSPLLLKAPNTLRIPGALGSMPPVNAALIYSFMVVSKVAPFRQRNTVSAGWPSESAPRGLSLREFQ